MSTKIVWRAHGYRAMARGLREEAERWEAKGRPLAALRLRKTAAGWMSAAEKMEERAAKDPSRRASPRSLVPSERYGR